METFTKQVCLVLCDVFQVFFAQRRNAALNNIRGFRNIIGTWAVPCSEALPQARTPHKAQGSLILCPETTIIWYLSCNQAQESHPVKFESTITHPIAVVIQSLFASLFLSIELYPKFILIIMYRRSNRRMYVLCVRIVIVVSFPTVTKAAETPKPCKTQSLFDQEENRGPEKAKETASHPFLAGNVLRAHPYALPLISSRLSPTISIRTRCWARGRNRRGTKTTAAATTT